MSVENTWVPGSSTTQVVVREHLVPPCAFLVLRQHSVQSPCKIKTASLMTTQYGRMTLITLHIDVTNCTCDSVVSQMVFNVNRHYVRFTQSQSRVIYTSNTEEFKEDTERLLYELYHHYIPLEEIPGLLKTLKWLKQYAGKYSGSIKLYFLYKFLLKIIR